jgi:hypothetical protein
MAFGIVQAVSGETTPQVAPQADDGNDPHAVALGRKGGWVGGKARAKAMTKAQRVASAKKVATARWAKKRRSPVSPASALVGSFRPVAR